jgi:hypothetical protein
MILVLSLSAMGLLLRTAAHQANVIEFVTEKKVKELPAGPLFWQVQNFPTLAQAQSASGETSIAFEVAGKVWLFTLGPMGSSRPGGNKIVEIGPVLPTYATEYLLRISWACAPDGTTLPRRRGRAAR